MPAVLKRIVPLLLVFAPLIFMAKMVRDNAVDIGCWDMWENAPLLQKWHNLQAGKMSWGEFGHDLYAAQIQHRIVVPRLIIIALTHLSGGDFRWEQYFTFLLLALDSLLLWMLVKRTMGGSAWRWPLMLAINLLLFSPMHYQIFFWGSSMWGTIPVTCLLGIIVLLAAPRGRGFWWRVITGILLAEIATHSFAHGLAIWPLLLLLVLLFQATLKQRLAAAACVFSLAAVTVAAYFHNFINVAHHAYNLIPGDHALKGARSLFEGDHLMQAVRFFLAFLGTWFARTPFDDNPLLAARILGVVTLLILTGGAALVLTRKSLRENWRAILPWLTLAAYVIGVGLMISKRGADIGEHRAVTPRYLAISQFLIVAMLAVPLVLKNCCRRDRPAGEASLGDVVTGMLLSAFIMAQFPVWQYGLHLTNVWNHARRQAQAVLLFLPHFKPDSLKVLDKDSPEWRCINAVDTLNSLRLLKFKPLSSPELKWFKRAATTLSPERANITTAAFRSDGSLALGGNARFSEHNLADAVLITRGDKVISLGQPAPRNLLRIFGLDYEFANIDDMPFASMYPWKGAIPATKLPQEKTDLEFWALSVSQMRIARLACGVTVDPVAKKVTITSAP